MEVNDAVYETFIEIYQYTLLFLVIFYVFSSEFFIQLVDLYAPHNTELLKKYETQVADPMNKKYINRRIKGIVALKLLSFVHCTILSTYSFNFLINDPLASTVVSNVLIFKDPFKEENELSLKTFLYADVDFVQKFTPFMVGFFICELFLFRYWPTSHLGVVANLDMLSHHIISCIMFPTNCVYSVGQHFLLFFFVYELSSIFLALTFIFEGMIGKSHVIYRFTGIFFIISFLCVRLLTVPGMLYLLYLCTEEMNKSLLLTFNILLVFIPVLLNVFWGKKILQMFLKQLSKLKTK